MTSESAAAMWGGHLPCRAPTINRFLATSNGKLIVLAVKPGKVFESPIILRVMI